MGVAEPELDEGDGEGAAGGAAARELTYQRSVEVKATPGESGPPPLVRVRFAIVCERRVAAYFCATTRSANTSSRTPRFA